MHGKIAGYAGKLLVRIVSVRHCAEAFMYFPLLPALLYAFIRRSLYEYGQYGRYDEHQYHKRFHMQVPPAFLKHKFFSASADVNDLRRMLPSGLCFLIFGNIAVFLPHMHGEYVCCRCLLEKIIHPQAIRRFQPGI